VESEQNCVLSFPILTVPARAVLFQFNVSETNILRKTINGVIGEILQSAVLAHQAGLGYGSELAIKAIQSSSAAYAVEETLKRLDRLDKGTVELTQKSGGSK
jgi:hypothetical protein